MKLFIRESSPHVQHLFWKNMLPCATVFGLTMKPRLFRIINDGYNLKTRGESSCVVIDIIQLSESIPGAVFFNKYIPQRS